MTDTFGQRQLLVQCKVDNELFPFFAETGYFSFVESMDLLYAVGTIQVVEAQSMLQSHYPLLQASDVDFYLQDDESNKHFGFYPFNGASVEQGGTKAYEHKISLISKHAFPISLHREYYSEYGTASDYVRRLADRLGLDHDVEETKHIFRWICPGWRAGQMLRHLAQHSVSGRGLSGYVYYVTNDGVLVFRSMDSFFEQSEDEEHLDVANLSQDVITQSIKRKYMSSVYLGSNNVKVERYDLDTDTAIESKYVFGDLVNKRALKLGLSGTSLEHGLSRSLYPEHSDHRDEYPHDELPMLFRKATSQYESTVIELLVKPNPFGRKLGEVINLSFPGEKSNDQSIPYSGRYLIAKVNTVGALEFYQRLTLVRPGVNITDRSDAK